MKWVCRRLWSSCVVAPSSGASVESLPRMFAHMALIVAMKVVRHITIRVSNTLTSCGREHEDASQEATVSDDCCNFRTPS